MDKFTMRFVLIIAAAILVLMGCAQNSTVKREESMKGVAKAQKNRGVSS